MNTDKMTVEVPKLQTLLTLEPVEIDVEKVLANVDRKRGLGTAERIQGNTKPKWSRLRVAAVAAAAIIICMFTTTGVASAVIGVDPITMFSNAINTVSRDNIHEGDLVVAAGEPESLTAYSNSAGLRFSDVKLVYRGATLPKNVTPDQIYWGVLSAKDADSTTGVALNDNEYLFVDFTVKNERSTAKEYGFNSTQVAVLGENNHVFGSGSEVCYYDGINMAKNEHGMLAGVPDGHDSVKKDGTPDYTVQQQSAKHAGFATLEPDEIRTFHVAFLIPKSTLELGSLYFTPDTSLGISSSDQSLPWNYIKLA
jgi:hypothetical protein